MNITSADLEVGRGLEGFDTALSAALEPAERAAMEVTRLLSAYEYGDIGGLPDGYHLTLEQLGGLAMLAQDLERHADRMRAWAESIRREATHLHAVTRPGAVDG